jgi:hypothetical protein
MTMTTELQASARQSARASVLADHDRVATAVSWNPLRPAGVSGAEPPGGRTFVDNILDAHDRFLAPRVISGADGCKNMQRVQMRKTY